MWLIKHSPRAVGESDRRTSEDLQVTISAPHILTHQSQSATWQTYQIDENDSLFWNTSLHEYFYGLYGATASRYRRHDVSYLPNDTVKDTNRAWDPVEGRSAMRCLREAINMTTTPSVTIPFR